MVVGFWYLWARDVPGKGSRSLCSRGTRHGRPPWGCTALQAKLSEILSPWTPLSCSPLVLWQDSPRWRALPDALHGCWMRMRLCLSIPSLVNSSCPPKGKLLVADSAENSLWLSVGHWLAESGRHFVGIAKANCWVQVQVFDLPPHYLDRAFPYMWNNYIS